MSPDAVIFGCIGIALLAMAVGSLVEYLGERAEKKRAAKRGGYLEIGPKGRKRLP